LTKFNAADQERIGLCTQFLTSPENLKNEKVEIKCQFSSVYRVLKLPMPLPEANSVQPIVMIAHGTGIAPFISMLSKIQNNQPLFDHFEIHFLFGARDNKEELLFEEYLL
jgi:sulfite reductase alpha subunit-like flavoprotein